MDSIFGDIFSNPVTTDGFSKRELKDRMKTTIARAKQGDKQQFIEALARDYIMIARGL